MQSTDVPLLVNPIKFSEGKQYSEPTILFNPAFGTGLNFDEDEVAETPQLSSLLPHIPAKSALPAKYLKDAYNRRLSLKSITPLKSSKHVATPRGLFIFKIARSRI